MHPPGTRGRQPAPRSGYGFCSVNFTKSRHAAAKGANSRRRTAMSRISDFTKVAYGARPLAATAAAHQSDHSGSTPPDAFWKASPNKKSYSATDTAGLDFLDGYPGIAPYLRGPSRPCTSRNAVDHPAAAWQILHSRRLQRLLPPQTSPPARRARRRGGRTRRRHRGSYDYDLSPRARGCRHGGGGDRLHLRACAPCSTASHSLT